MSSYDEHLISMAGGDGETITAVAEYVRQRKMMSKDLGPIVHNAWSDPKAEMATLTVDHLEALLTLVREQVAKLDAVRDLANWAGKRGWTLDAAAIRKALEQTP